MRIGLSFDLKGTIPLRTDEPDDAQEEFDSPDTVEAIAGVLRSLGHRVEKLGDGPSLLRRLLADPPDFVFNLAEGTGISRSREARAPAVLEMLAIPYSGSDPFTLAVTLDKSAAKTLVAAAGVAVPRGRLVTPAEAANGQWDARDIPFPALIKPAWEGSSKGIRTHCLVDQPSQLHERVAELARLYRQPILVEEFIGGDEVTVGVIGNDPPTVIGSMRILPQDSTRPFVYSLEAKRHYQRMVRYEAPAQLPLRVAERIQWSALTAYRVLGCRDIARLDFRLQDSPEGPVPCFLEANPLPGLHPQLSDLVILARASGWTYERLVGAILEAALARYGLVGGPRRLAPAPGDSQVRYEASLARPGSF
ncbi:MAG: D-alanine--D-alanine ligase [Gemmataceae bacterium]